MYHKNLENIQKLIFYILPDSFKPFLLRCHSVNRQKQNKTRYVTICFRNVFSQAFECSTSDLVKL